MPTFQPVLVSQSQKQSKTKARSIKRGNSSSALQGLEKTYQVDVQNSLSTAGRKRNNIGSRGSTRATS